MNLSRRSFLAHGAAALAASAAWPLKGAPPPPRIRVGACILGLVDARAAGLDGVEVRAGNEADELDVFRPDTRARYKEQMLATGLPICSIMMGLLNQFPLATDPRGPAWLEQCIDAARDLGAGNILIAFFGKGDLQAGKQVKEDEFKAAARRIRDAAPRAADAGVTLAIENMLSAEQNLRMLETINHNAVRIYYDVYNTGKTMGYDAPAEIRLLGDRISQVHYKNGPQYLDEDPPFFKATTAALKQIGFAQWVVLETSSPSKNGVEDARRNGDYVRQLFA